MQSIAVYCRFWAGALLFPTIGAIPSIRRGCLEEEAPSPGPTEKPEFPMPRSVGLAGAEAPDQAGVDQVIAQLGELEQLDRR